MFDRNETAMIDYKVIDCLSAGFDYCSGYCWKAERDVGQKSIRVLVRHLVVGV